MYIILTTVCEYVSGGGGNNGGSIGLPGDSGAGSNTGTINSAILSGSTQLSNILVAKTIIHEMLHAYLNVKYLDINSGTVIPYLTNEELQNLLNTYFNATCPINGAQCQHNFMINEFIPVFQTIFSEIREELLSQEDIDDFNVIEIIDQNGIVLEPFIWDNFYKYIAFSGLHQSQTYLNTTASNPTELYKYQLYNNYAKNTNKNCI